MSDRHVSIVGHFDPVDLETISLACARIDLRSLIGLRSLDPERVAGLLASYGEEVADCTFIRDGCVYCEWSSDRSGRACEFIECLADSEGAIVIESPGYVRYPEVAARQFLGAAKGSQTKGDC